jgi:hypothetical protein
MTTTTALPEKLRLARNIEEGYEVLTTTNDGNKLWATVVSVLEICAPIAIVSLSIEVDGERVRMPGVRPTDRIMSRRNAT